ELVPGATMPTFTSMQEKGEPDVAPEFWANAAIVALNKAVDEGKMHTLNKAPITGLGEGWWVLPATLEKHPELTTADAILKRPDLFPHPEDPSKGGFHICPPGWNCELSNRNHFRAWGMEEKGWAIVETGSAAGLDGSIAKAAERGENWFGYYWSPTSMIGKYKMHKLDFGVPFGGKDNWDNCIVKPEKDCANPKKSSWVKSEVNSVVSANFKKNAGVALDYIKNRVFPGDIMNSMLVFMTDQKAGGKDAAYEFLAKHGKVWESWVSSDVAKKVKSAL
ncbi:MAG: ABC transporter substrate-binding protein, partial [SAR116 cluster bacterium]|nr:ABC transporter substrate-binding protein [SAR116 cluster bacterium]